MRIARSRSIKGKTKTEDEKSMKKIFSNDFCVLCSKGGEEKRREEKKEGKKEKIQERWLDLASRHCCFGGALVHRIHRMSSLRHGISLDAKISMFLFVFFVFFCTTKKSRNEYALETSREAFGLVYLSLGTCRGHYGMTTVRLGK
jgi:hypothetical protein